jgi:hypothetical protein
MSPKHYIPRIFTTIIVHSLLMRNDIDVNKHQRLSNSTLRHKQSKGTVKSSIIEGSGGSMS